MLTISNFTSGSISGLRLETVCGQQITRQKAGLHKHGRPSVVVIEWISSILNASSGLSPPLNLQRYTAMSSPYTLATNVSPTNSSPHHMPQCFDSKLDNISSPNALANYDAKDGGIPINFGLNCLGWMVSKQLYSLLLHLV